jgi:hypothetical protein
LASAYLSSIALTTRICCTVSISDHLPDDPPPPDPIPRFQAIPFLSDLAVRCPSVAVDTAAVPSQVSHIKTALTDLVGLYSLDPIRWQNLNNIDMIMPLDFDEFVRHFVHPSTRVLKIQREVSKELNFLRACALFRDLEVAAESSDDHEAFLQYRRNFHLRKPDANLWATALPTSRDLRLSNMEYHIAVQNNLGLDAFVYPAHQSVRCCHSDCNVDLLQDPEHPFTCIQNRKRGRNRQHNNVQAILERMIRACGGRVEHPTHLSIDLPNPNERPDIMVSLICNSFLIDVRGLHPLAASYLDRNGDTCLQEAFDNKIQKYDAIFQRHHLKTLPFVFTTLGDIHYESHSLFGTLARYFSETNPQLISNHHTSSASATVHFYKTAISVAIMRDNANILLDCHGRSKIQLARRA